MYWNLDKVVQGIERWVLHRDRKSFNVCCRSFSTSFHSIFQVFRMYFFHRR